MKGGSWRLGHNRMRRPVGANLRVRPSIYRADTQVCAYTALAGGLILGKRDFHLLVL